MNFNHGDFWLDRLAETVENAMAARTERTRAAYVELARHYRSMYKLTQRPVRRLAAAQPACQSAELRRLDFGSVHDVLMRAA